MFCVDCMVCSKCMFVCLVCVGDVAAIAGACLLGCCGVGGCATRGASGVLKVQFPGGLKVQVQTPIVRLLIWFNFGWKLVVDLVLDDVLFGVF